MEDVFFDIAQMVTDQSVVILIDRGLLDGSAYTSKDNWQCIMDDMGSNVVMLRDKRYDGILHMVTAADGAQQFYSVINKESQYESIQQAIDIDKKLRAAYMGH